MTLDLTVCWLRAGCRPSGWSVPHTNPGILPATLGQTIAGSGHDRVWGQVLQHGA